MQDRQDRPTRCGRGGAKGEGDRRREDDQWRGDQLQQHVLHHVDAEEHPLVGVNRRDQGNQDGRQSAHEQPAPMAWHRVGGMTLRDPPLRPQVRSRGQHDAEDRQGIEGPGQQDRWEAWDGRVIVVGQRDGRRKQQHRGRE